MTRAIGRLFGGGEAPKIPEEKVMPLADEEAAKKARKKSIAKQRARAGRASTILSDEKLG